jgi:hypothetical protein
MEDPAKVMIVAMAFGSGVYTVGIIVRAAVSHRKETGALERASGTPLTEVRLARIEQAVDAIALEVERISEGQRFTTRLLSEQSLQPKLPPLQLSSNTPI